MAHTQRYLEKGTRLVILPRSTREVQWYTTKKEVVLDVEPEIVNCPLTGQRVHSFILEGIRIFFPPNIVRSRELFDEGDLDEESIKNMRPVLFIYDIPDNATYTETYTRIVNGQRVTRTRERPFLNPSDQLRTFAIRLNLSCWVMNEGDIPHTLINRMLDAGCDPRVFRFSPEESLSLVKEAVAKLKFEINSALTRAEQARARAERQLNEAGTEDGMTPELAEERYLERANQINARLESLRNDLKKVSERFGINERVLSTDRLAIAGETLKKQMADRARAYVAAANTLRETGSLVGEGLANAADMNAAPPEMLYDALLDEGKTEEANKVKDAFGIHIPEPVEVPVEEQADDGTFSLTEGLNDEDEK